MADVPTPTTFDLSEAGVYSTSTALVALNATAAAATPTWPTANLAILVPMRLSRPRTVYKMATGCGATGGGNFDLGIYDRFGVRMTSSGATARVASSEVICDVTDKEVGPGLYYLAMSADNNTSTYVLLTPSGTSPVPLQKAKLYGTLEAANCYPLPATLTRAGRTGALIPAIAAMFRPY